MSDRSLLLRIDAKPTSGLDKPFKEMGKAAETANNRLKGMTEQAGRFKESLSSIRGGLAGLSVSGVLPGSIGKMADQLTALSSAAEALKGTGGLISGLGLTKAAALAAVPVLAKVGAAVAAIGAAAVIASPQLQDTLGGALHKLSEDGKEQLALMARLKQAHSEIGEARRFGIGTAKEEALAQAELSVRRPIEQKIDSLEEQRARTLDRAEALRRFGGDEPFSKTQDTLNSLRPDDLKGNLAKLKGLADTPYQTPASLKRSLFEEERATTRARDWASELQDKSMDMQERHEGSKAMGARIAAQESFEQRKAELADKFHLSGPAVERMLQKGREGKLGGADEEFVAMVQRANEAKDSIDAQRRTEESLLRGRKPVTATEYKAFTEDLSAAKDKSTAQAEKLLQIKHQIRQAEIDHLKAIQQSTAEQAKLASEAVREMEARIKGTKLNLHFGDQNEKISLLDISRRFKEGGIGSLENHELQTLRSQGLLKEEAEKEGIRRAEADPVTQEILKNLGADKKLQEAKEQEKVALKLDADIKHQIEVKVAADAAALAKDMNSQVVPSITKAIDDLGGSLGVLIEQALKRELQKALQEIRQNSKATT